MDLKGKIVNFLGDSITEGVGVEECRNLRYDNIIKEKCGLKSTNNYGISGTRLAYQTAPSVNPSWDLYFCGRAYRMDKSADLIVVYGGVNDCIHGDAPFGEIGDKSPSTFCGAVEYLMTELNELFPNAAKVFMTPAKMNYSDVMPKSGRKLTEYGSVIKITAEKHNISVLDLHERLPIDPNIEADKEKYTIDGLHFNAEGHKVIADTLIDFIENEM